MLSGGNCVFCYSHSSYFGEKPRKYLINEQGEYISSKGNIVSEENKITNQYYDEFNEKWSSENNNAPSLLKIINSKGE
ncbi:hypothetical protein [Peptostreptococcus porci]|uniref:hypothetical protein n=1 Tax=Peptostreptococcus porci TaxID=2652282 RepID=UPI002A80222E|nr:hypothetical protein [Peptostreptococcus porci]MDY4127838.1 hypothetical protein [Peptostreptococcus porci]